MHQESINVDSNFLATSLCKKQLAFGSFNFFSFSFISKNQTTKTKIADKKSMKKVKCFDVTKTMK